MRRTDRLVTDNSKIESFLKEYDIMHVGFYDGHKPYIFPVNFGYEFINEKLILYFHGADSGTKAELSKSRPVVAFEMERNNGVAGDGTQGCKYSCFYNSIMGSGTITVLENNSDKRHALDIIMKKATGKSGFEYNENVLDKTNVYRILADEFSAKEKIY